MLMAVLLKKTVMDKKHLTGAWQAPAARASVSGHASNARLNHMNRYMYDVMDYAI
jgi:hypothetical protein